MKRFFTIPQLTRQNEFNESRKYFSVDNLPRDDTSHKTAWYLLNVNINLESIFNTGDALTMDESMGLCQSRCRFTVLMKSKPIKKGFKFYLVFCGNTGMCVGIVLHNQLRGTTSLSGFTTDIVKRSVENLNINMAGKTVVVDNYYGSITLGELLKSTFNCYLVATIRSNRIPDEFLTFIKISQYLHNNNNGTLSMPYRFKQVFPEMYLFCNNDINTFQLLLSNPQLVQRF